LKEIPRTGWAFAGVPLAEIEDVAQHSFEVASLTLLLCDNLDERKTKINREKALAMAIIHDWPEALVADFPYTAVEFLGGKEVKLKMEEKAAALLLPRPRLELWREYVENKTAEAKIVHAADYLSMLLQALKYAERGNVSREMRELWAAVLNDVSKYSEEFSIVKELTAQLSAELRRLSR
ncbi:MAG: HD domain-containing protein, partial [Candidatus Hadarchaeales archaeon]